LRVTQNGARRVSEIDMGIVSIKMSGIDTFYEGSAVEQKCLQKN
jgi:hypothetical protein